MSGHEHNGEQSLASLGEVQRLFAEEALKLMREWQMEEIERDKEAG